MPKKYIVRLKDSERRECLRVIRELDGKSRKVRRAYILLKSDVDGDGWTDEEIAAAYLCRVATVAEIRKRLVLSGFDTCLNGKQRLRAPRAKLLDGVQEAKIIALRLGDPPPGYSRWALRLLSERVVALQICPSVSHETCRILLKKTV